MSTVSRGFQAGGNVLGSSCPGPVPGPVPGPGLPVRSAGPTPSIALGDWELVITSQTDQQRWDWDGFHALPPEPVTVDLPCVTHWSKLDTLWEEGSLDTLGTDAVRAWRIDWELQASRSV